MHLLVLPEYDVAAPHVLVDTVYSRLLPEAGHVVSQVRPRQGAVALEEVTPPWSGGRLVLYPGEPPGGPLQNAARAWRKRRWIRRALRMFDAAPPDAVLVRNDLISAAAALRFARRHRRPFLFQVSSPEAEFRIHGAGSRGLLRAGFDRVRGHLDLVVRRRTCRRSSAVLAISRAMRLHMVQEEGIADARTFSFPMGCGSAPLLDASGAAGIRAALRLPQDGTIVYSGVIDAVREPGFMLDVLELVRARVSDAVLLVLTSQQDQRRVSFEADAARRGLPVRIVGPLSHRDVPRYVQAADVALSCLPPRHEYVISSPTKTLEAMAVGIPVVGNEEIEEHQHVLRDTGAGLTVPYDARAAAGAVVELLMNRDRRRRLGEAGRAWALAHRGYEHLTAYLLEIIEATVRGDDLAGLAHDPD